MTAAPAGYLRKDRMLDLDDFLDARSRVVAGGSAIDPEIVRQMIRLEDERLTPSDATCSR